MGGAGANVGSVITAITSSVTKCEIGKVKGSKTGSSRNGITDSSKIPIQFTRDLIAQPKFSLYFLILEKLVTEHGKLGQPVQTLELIPVLRIFLKLSSK